MNDLNDIFSRTSKDPEYARNAMIKLYGKESVELIEKSMSQLIADTSSDVDINDKFIQLLCAAKPDSALTKDTFETMIAASLSLKDTVIQKSFAHAKIFASQATREELEMVTIEYLGNAMRKTILSDMSDAIKAAIRHHNKR